MKGTVLGDKEEREGLRDKRQIISDKGYWIRPSLVLERFKIKDSPNI